MRLAVILFNLGGPDFLEAVRPFLQNLFSDRAIIDLPAVVRLPLAWLIAKRRADVARKIYSQLGGSSPILPQTRAQAEALQQALVRQLPQHETKVFVSMRYWHPMSDETVTEVTEWKPDRLILLPLYPQLSTTTSVSSLQDWSAAAGRVALTAPAQAICCYAQEPGFIEASAALIAVSMQKAEAAGPVRLLFSAHGLPEKIVARGDPYPWHVARSAEAIVARLAMPDLDWGICYQSRVGPLKWIGPSTEAEIERAAHDRRVLVLFPIAFVSEHSETLVELDIDYAALARKLGVLAYHRVPTVGTHPAFIDGLAALVAQALQQPTEILNDGTLAACDASHGRCPLRTAMAIAR